MESESTHLPVLDSRPLSPTPPVTGQNGSQVDNRAGDAEGLAYAPMRPRKTVRLSVAYRIRGRGQPLPYSLDEEPGE
jgi:hypothetical protein